MTDDIVKNIEEKESETVVDLEVAKCRICCKYARETHVVRFRPRYGTDTVEIVCNKCYNKLMTKNRWVWMHRLW